MHEVCCDLPQSAGETADCGERSRFRAGSRPSATMCFPSCCRPTGSADRAGVRNPTAAGLPAVRPAPPAPDRPPRHQVAVHPLQLAQQVEVQSARGPPRRSRQAGEMRRGRGGLELPKRLLFRHQPASGPRVLGHEHGRSSAHRARQAQQQRARLRLLRRSPAACRASGGAPHGPSRAVHHVGRPLPDW